LEKSNASLQCVSANIYFTINSCRRSSILIDLLFSTHRAAAGPARHAAGGGRRGGGRRQPTAACLAASLRCASTLNTAPPRSDPPPPRRLVSVANLLRSQAKRAQRDARSSLALLGARAAERAPPTAVCAEE